MTRLEVLTMAREKMRSALQSIDLCGWHADKAKDCLADAIGKLNAEIRRERYRSRKGTVAAPGAG